MMVVVLEIAEVVVVVVVEVVLVLVVSYTEPFLDSPLFFLHARRTSEKFSSYTHTKNFTFFYMRTLNWENNKKKTAHILCGLL